MNIKHIIENNATISILSLLLGGFLAGIGVYKFILETAKLDTVRRGTYYTKDDLQKNYVLIDKYNQDIKYKGVEQDDIISNSTIKIINEDVQKITTSEDSLGDFKIITSKLKTFNVVEYNSYFEDYASIQTSIFEDNNNNFVYIRIEKEVLIVHYLNTTYYLNLDLGLAKILKKIIEDKNSEYLYSHINNLKASLNKNECKIDTLGLEAFVVSCNEYDYFLSPDDDIKDWLSIFSIKKKGITIIDLDGILSSKYSTELSYTGFDATHGLYHLVRKKYSVNLNESGKDKNASFGN